ncbi:LIVCS family branched-chain amino acid:cation transporter [Desulfohalotomaculum tongense]|uniref:branched-chain amino acid transport system II carrier protein n=1 Tax=Desulforadius tongensis TaxID=1216062 RepID=UPI00195E8136|nr:branched-chain amino acid transport system II carrier protein [Desulforadius tongensis]MBM7853972.1 LIVCS family branched-chain amino acid:cation transporter [Desulforadius tongensis]
MHLTKKEIFITGLALLAMFLGAGNLIFPPVLGLKAGESLWLAILGFIVTGVGLPLLGVTAVAKAGGDLQYLANRVHPLFSKIITTIVVLSIGPLLAIPRTAATTFEVGVAPFLQDTNSQLALAVTTVVYFAITLGFVLRPSKIVDNIGKFLTPFIIIFLAIIIFKGVLTPLGTVNASEYTSPFSQGFLEGYNTMDALASVIFGLVIANSIKAKGVTDNGEIAKVTIIAGIIAAIGLSSVYVGLAYIGATTGTTFTGGNPGQMLSYIIEAILGPAGKIVIAITMALACLTTSIGLVATCGSFFSRLTNNRVSYNTVCILTALISTVLANMGLATILEVSVPLLITVYPVIIVLILLALFHDLYKGKRAVYIAAISGTVIISLTTLVTSTSRTLGFELTALEQLLYKLPLHKQGLDWLLPAVLLALVGMLYKSKTETF